MKNISNKLIIGISVLVFVVTQLTFQPSTAFACSCVADIQQEEIYEMSKAVFSGRVLSVDSPSFRWIDILKIPDRKARIQVLENWKGVDSGIVTVATGSGGGDCGFDFKEGEEYLIYAHDSEQYRAKLETNICNRTKLLASAEEDLKILGEGKKFLANIPESGVSMKPAFFVLVTFVALIILGAYFLTKKIINFFKK